MLAYGALRFAQPGRLGLKQRGPVPLLWVRALVIGTSTCGSCGLGLLEQQNEESNSTSSGDIRSHYAFTPVRADCECHWEKRCRPGISWRAGIPAGGSDGLPPQRIARSHTRGFDAHRRDDAHLNRAWLCFLGAMEPLTLAHGTFHRTRPLRRRFKIPLHEWHSWHLPSPARAPLFPHLPPSRLHLPGKAVVVDDRAASHALP